MEDWKIARKKCRKYGQKALRQLSDKNDPYSVYKQVCFCQFLFSFFQLALFQVLAITSPAVGGHDRLFLLVFAFIFLFSLSICLPHIHRDWCNASTAPQVSHKIVSCTVRKHRKSWSSIVRKKQQQRSGTLFSFSFWLFLFVSLFPRLCMSYLSYLLIIVWWHGFALPTAVLAAYVAT